jgi:NADP-dependent 3-hydroxy acid dehydrogenase YdfG
LPQEIKDKVVVITGASSGLGEATARRLAQEGAKLVLGARRLERLQALAEELSLGDEAVVQTDVTDREQVENLVKHAVQTHGRVDAIINNAGLMPLSPLEALKVEDWDRTIDVNLKGVLYGIAAVLPHMKEQQGGHVINVSSVAGHKVGPGGAVYSATKYGVRVISEALRQEVKPYNIRTTVISPGAVATELPGSVSFAPGARTAWHTHSLGQTIHVTEGLGLCQRRGGPVEVIRPGDRVFFKPGEDHWHGAAPNRFMNHIAMQEVDEQGIPLRWGEHVSDEEYGAAPSIDG